MDRITEAQVGAIMGQIDGSSVVSYTLQVDNYNTHCFVSMQSGQDYVIRISRKGWPQTDWKLYKFMRECAAAEVIATHTDMATPQTYFIDASLSVINAVYAIQARVPGTVFRKIFDRSEEEDQIELLRLFGATAAKIHAIPLPQM